MGTRTQSIKRSIAVRARGGACRALSSVDEKIGRRPDVRGSDETLDTLEYGSFSMSRYGDGELMTILGRGPQFQRHDKLLASRLSQILTSNREDLLICIPDVFGNNERFDLRSQQYWAKHLSHHRHDYYRLLDMQKTYYDSLVSRVYKELADKRPAERRFDRWKRVWQGRDVVFVEGRQTRLGVGNDLFTGAASIRRILAPPEHAFSVYDELLVAAKKFGNEVLFILALGPTATVLAYDLAALGYRALDLGHLDIEYEWFLRAESRVPVPGKYVNEALSGNIVSDCEDEQYLSEIIYSFGGP